MLTPSLMRAHGLSPQRLHRQDIRRLAHGIYLPKVAPEDLRLTTAMALSRTLTSTCLSDATAASYYGFALPGFLGADSFIHLSQPDHLGSSLRRPGVKGHRRRLHDKEVQTFDGVHVTTPARTWFDLACQSTLLEAVQLGDLLVRQPRPRFEKRSHPWCSPAQLTEVVQRTGRVRGKATARAALELIRVGADSFPETALRLALVQAGLPEPELQIQLNPAQPSSPAADAGYRQWRIIIQYDGESHFTPEQQRRDQNRDNHFTAAGWTLLRFNARDLREGFTSAVAQVRRLIADRPA